MSVRPLPLIGLAHGSRHPGGAAATTSLLAAVAAQGDVVAGAAYLDLAEPDLSAVSLRLAEAGHRAAVVVPLLFTAAFHATVDVPEAVRAAAASSGLELIVTEILGTGDDLADLLLAHATASGLPETADLLLYAVGSSDADANAAVAELATRLAARRGTRVAAAFATASPRADDVLPELGEPVAVLPLFLADGLLLSSLRARAAEQGWPMAPPLGDRAAPLVLRRYDEAAACRRAPLG